MITIHLDTAVIPPRVQAALTEPTNPIHSSTPAGQTAMNVGVPIRLTLDAGGGSLTNVGGITWSISGGAPIKDYEISAYDPTNPDDPDGSIRGYLTACNTTPLDVAADLNGVAEVTFYFTDVGTCVVTVVAEVDGTPEVGSIIFDVKRDAKPEIYYVTGPFGDDTGVEDRNNILGEHYYWHLVAEDAPGFNDDNPGRFFHFHRGFIAKFDCWRGIFGYPCVKVYVPGPNHLPSGRDADHVGEPGQGNGIVSEERHSSPGSIPALPAKYSIAGDGTTKLEDYADANELHQAIVGFHNSMHTTYLCSFGDFLSAETTPADPIFWRFHYLLTLVLELHQTLMIDGQTISVLATGPGGAQGFYPDPDIEILPDCSGGIPSIFTPASGHLFPVGRTTVTGVARDVVLLDPDADPDPVVQESIVGAGGTKAVSFSVDVLPLLATPIPADIYLVLDDTGSMTGTTPAGPGGEAPTKIQALKDSMATLMDVLRVHREGVGDNIGAFTFKVPDGEPSGGCKAAWLQQLVSFGSLDDRVQNNAANPLDIDNAVAGMPADGDATPIRIAVQESSDQLNVQPTDRKRWIILLTDGKQNTDDCLIGSVREPEYNDPQVVNFRNDFLASRQINFLGVGFGAGNAINGPLLRTLAAGPDDYFDYASEGPGSLSKWFNAAVARVLDQAEVVDPHGVISTGEVATEQVPLTRTCRSATFILTWAEPDLEVPPRLVVESPGAEPIRITEADHDPARGITWITGRFHKIVVLRFPVRGELGEYHRGVWTATVCGPGSIRREEKTSYTLAVLADEAVRLACHLPDSKIVTREPIPLQVMLEGDAIRSATVTAEIVALQQGIGSQLSAFDADDREAVAKGLGSERNAGLMERRMDLLNEKFIARKRAARRTLHTIELREVDRRAGGRKRGRVFTGVTRPLKSDGAHSVVIRVEGVTFLGDRFRRECSMGFYAASKITKPKGEIHVDPVDDSGLVFDWRGKPSTGAMISSVLGPGHAASFDVRVRGGSAGDVVDHGDGTYTARITRDSVADPAHVAVRFAGEPFVSFRIPRAPLVAAVTPSSGPEEGGNVVRIHGEHFARDTSVRFGDRVVEDVAFVSETLLQVDAPAGKGVVIVNVTDHDGTTGSGAVAYRYLEGADVDPCAPTEKATKLGAR